MSLTNKSILFFPLFCFAQVLQAQCIDSDGDGWGWNGIETCQVPVTAQTCTDTLPVGDGWGWDGSTSCRIDAIATNCVDTDPVGDGWGWDGVTSCSITTLESVDQSNDACVDSPPLGDGWGWDGTASCPLPTASTQGTSCISHEGISCIDVNRDDLGPRFHSDPNNLIRNGTFDEGFEGTYNDAMGYVPPHWTTFVHPDAMNNTAFRFSGRDLSLYSGGPASEWWHAQAYSSPIRLEEGRTYQLSFSHTMGTAVGNGRFSVVVENGTNFTKYLARQDIRSSVPVLRYQVDFFMPVSDDNARVTFNLGDTFGLVSFHDVVLIAID